LGNNNLFLNKQGKRQQEINFLFWVVVFNFSFFVFIFIGKILKIFARTKPRPASAGRAGNSVQQKRKFNFL